MNCIVNCILLLFLISCQKKEEPTHFYGRAMTIDYHIIVGKRLSAQEIEQVEAEIKSCFAAVDRIYNKWNPDSELSRLNRMPAGIKRAISPEMMHLLTLTDEVVALTEGRFDPAIEPLQKVWKRGTLPEESDLALAIAAAGWDKIHFENDLFWKDHDFSALDLGGIAKGYCVDLLLERLSTLYDALFVEWGGEIRASGKHPENRPWKIFISRLGHPDVKHAIDVLPLENQAIATSGDYMQNWTVGNDTYCHIIDPHTHKPLLINRSSISSASVLAKNCALADGLATAAMLFPTLEEAQDWALKVQKKHPEIQFWFIQ